MDAPFLTPLPKSRTEHYKKASEPKNVFIAEIRSMILVPSSPPDGEREEKVLPLRHIFLLREKSKRESGVWGRRKKEEGEAKNFFFFALSLSSRHKWSVRGFFPPPLQLQRAREGCQVSNMVRDSPHKKGEKMH